MNYYAQGASDALFLFKIAGILENRLGRKLVSNALQTAFNPEHKPRIMRTLEPYYNEYIKYDPTTAFDEFDTQLQE